MGCHIAQDTIKDDKGVVRVAHRDDFPLERHFGFNLTGVGSKTNANWVFNWVKNPKAYDPNAPMPSLRQTDQEAADICSRCRSRHSCDRRSGRRIRRSCASSPRAISSIH